MSRIDESKTDLSNILTKWQQALGKPETTLNRDASILRFELAFEVGWKLIQKLAINEGYTVKSPRQAFQQAFNLGWITNEIIWDDILKARNTATHVYREAYAQALYEQLPGYLDAFWELEKSIHNN